MSLHGDQVAEQRVVFVALLDRRHALQFGLHLGDLPPQQTSCRRASTPAI